MGVGVGWGGEGRFHFVFSASKRGSLVYDQSSGAAFLSMMKICISHGIKNNAASPSNQHFFLTPLSSVLFSPPNPTQPPTSPNAPAEFTMPAKLPPPCS